MASVTCTVAENIVVKSVVELYVDGEPEIRPVDGSMVRPTGRAPAGMLHVYGGRPPGVGTAGLMLPTCICTEYGVLTCATPRDVPSCARTEPVASFWFAAISTSRSVSTISESVVSATENGTLESCTVNVTWNVPSSSGVPPMMPDPFRVRPSGRPDELQMNGAMPDVPEVCICRVPPWRASVTDLPTMRVGSVEVRMATGTVSVCEVTVSS